MDSMEGSGNHSGGRGGGKRSMLSMVGDDYMDANVAANEREVRLYSPCSDLC